MTKLAMRYDLTERPNRVKRISKKWIMKLYYVLSVYNKGFFLFVTNKLQPMTVEIHYTFMMKKMWKVLVGK